MKRGKMVSAVVGAVLTMVLMGVAVSVVAQEERTLTSSTFDVVSVYDSPYGFKVVYRQRDLSERVIYVPVRWIYQDKVALVTYSKSRAVPYLQLFYDVDVNEFAFLRLVLPRSAEHYTWSFSQEENLRAQFDNASVDIF